MSENRENFDLSMHPNGFSRDMLHKFMNGKRFMNEEEEEDENEEIELSLGLSMNGRFGVDPKRAAKKLKHSSSISNLVFRVDAGGVSGFGEGGRQAVGVSVDLYEPLMRTRSLPVEAEEELKKRKELQSMRRMEAKKRLEKLKNGRLVKEKVDMEENSCGDNNNCEINVNRNGNETPLSQGSIGSYGSGSSGITDFQNPHLEISVEEVGIGKDKVDIVELNLSSCQLCAAQKDGVKQSIKAKSPPSVQSLPAQIEHKPVQAAEKEANEILKNVMLDMPRVSTKGDGPNGKKIEGFLYQYKKGEEVKIVCVCHGRFLSPAEFVKHAGGADVPHPLKHIVVNHV
ncbi:unnamed protein product [Fraxinus pennsylvanica]|uniref:Ninja-family protein n=1 Tax=Fraxinus pennsylvanica TaxID=56036 RepID=A0AAD1Z5V2_9LAMI|nr:unnamed protein product [Fraxinus pennsylvanica]